VIKLGQGSPRGPLHRDGAHGRRTCCWHQNSRACIVSSGGALPSSGSSGGGSEGTRHSAGAGGGGGYHHGLRTGGSGRRQSHTIPMPVATTTHTHRHRHRPTDKNMHARMQARTQRERGGGEGRERRTHANTASKNTHMPTAPNPTAFSFQSSNFRETNKPKKNISGKIKGARSPADIEGVICGVHGPHFAPGQGPLHIAKKG